MGHLYLYFRSVERGGRKMDAWKGRKGGGKRKPGK